MASAKTEFNQHIPDDNHVCWPVLGIPVPGRQRLKDPWGSLVSLYVLSGEFHTKERLLSQEMDSNWGTTVRLSSGRYTYMPAHAWEHAHTDWKICKVAPGLQKVRFRVSIKCFEMLEMSASTAQFIGCRALSLLGGQWFISASLWLEVLRWH